MPLRKLLVACSLAALPVGVATAGDWGFSFSFSRGGDYCRTYTPPVYTTCTSRSYYNYYAPQAYYSYYDSDTPSFVYRDYPTAYVSYRAYRPARSAVVAAPYVPVTTYSRRVVTYSDYAPPRTCNGSRTVYRSAATPRASVRVYNDGHHYYRSSNVQYRSNRPVVHHRTAYVGPRHSYSRNVRVYRR